MDLSKKSTGEIILYQPDETVKLEVRVENETVWLTQAQMAELFQTTIPNINLHLKNIYEEGELDEFSTIKDFLIVRQEGKRRVKRKITFYNLDAIISVGYRITSRSATLFRRWATRVLKEYLLKGFVINQRIERVENFAIETQKKLSETRLQMNEINIKLNNLVQNVEDVLSDQNDINEDTRTQLELFHQTLADLQANKIWIDKPQNPMLN